ncbi:MAG: beta-ketoacyl synthase chain length factor [Bacteroidales bacterium]|nr:beta-ketoacyl synthase chain length factor [Bacteroidales bacterium]
MEKKIYINTRASVEGCNEPDYKEFIPDPVARRRMSRIIKMGVTSAFIALNEWKGKAVDGIITGTGWGCLADTEKFLNSIYENDERLLNPSSFIQSTPNTIGAQIALFLGSKCYNVSYVHGGISFESALIDSISMLQEQDNITLLVGGFDEMSATKEHILDRMGVWRKAKPGEGAQFFVIGNTECYQNTAEIESVTTFTENSELSDTVDISSLIDRIGVTLDEEYRILCGIGNPYSSTENMGKNIIDYKQICGEYPTASAFGLWHACGILEEEPHIGKIIIITRHLRERISVIVVNNISK